MRTFFSKYFLCSAVFPGGVNVDVSFQTFTFVDGHLNLLFLVSNKCTFGTLYTRLNVTIVQHLLLLPQGMTK